MTDTELLDYLEFLAHGYTVTLTRDWTYELTVNDSEPIKAKSIRECLVLLKNSNQQALASGSSKVKTSANPNPSNVRHPDNSVKHKK